MVMKRYIGWIYKIINTTNNKIYIGQTRTSIQKRFKQHIASSKNPKSSTYTTYFNAAIRKYGEPIFKVECLLKITAYSESSRIVLLDTFERFYIKKYKSNINTFGYNSTEGGQMVCSSKQKITESLRNKIKHTECCVEGCSKSHFAKGYCSKHYSQLYKYNRIKERTHLTKNEIVLFQDHAEVKLYDKDNDFIQTVLIDLEDVDKIKNYKWYLFKCPRGNYAKNNKVGKMHNLILLKNSSDQVIIHLNKNGLDNRKSNLNIVTQQQKQRENKLSSNNKSGTKGVWGCAERNKWQAQVTINNKTKSLGRFDNLEDAIQARLTAEKIYYL